MQGINPLLLALASAALVMALAYWWFGVHRRRKIEMESGITALADMKWRDCLGLILRALARDGYVERHDGQQAGDGGSDHLLDKNGQVWLLTYKHGTAYRLGESNVREFAATMQLQGADRGMLVTLGSSEGLARDMARRQNIELLDAAAIWPRVRDFLPADIGTRIRLHAASVTRRGIDIGMLAGLALGVGVYFVSRPPVPAAVGNTLPASETLATQSAPPAAEGATDAATLQANEAADALQTVASLTDEERAKRRVAAASGIAGIRQVRSAVWSTQSTLVLALATSDGSDQDLVAEACRILVQYEELRFSRLQLEPPQPNEQPVRWRQCQ